MEILGCLSYAYFVLSPGLAVGFVAWCPPMLVPGVGVGDLMEICFM